MKGEGGSAVGDAGEVLDVSVTDHLAETDSRPELAIGTGAHPDYEGHDTHDAPRPARRRQLQLDLVAGRQGLAQRQAGTTPREVEQRQHDVAPAATDAAA